MSVSLVKKVSLVKVPCILCGRMMGKRVEQFCGCDEYYEPYYPGQGDREYYAYMYGSSRY